MYCFVLLLSTKYYDVILRTTKCSYVIRPSNELPHTKPCTYFTTYYYIRQHTIMYRYILPHEMPITKCRASRLRRFSEKPCPIQCPADLSFLDTKLWKTITFHAPATTPCHQILPFARRVTRQDRLILRQAKITKHCPAHATKTTPNSTTKKQNKKNFLYWTVPYWSVRLLNYSLLIYSFTELCLGLHWTVLPWNFPLQQCLYWNILLLNCSFTKVFTELFLYWASPLVTCPFTEVSSTKVLLYWTIPSLNCPFQSYSFLNCSFTKLLLYWSVKHWTVLSGTIPLLSCSFTKLLLYWSVKHWTYPLLNCSFTELVLQ